MTSDDGKLDWPEQYSDETRAALEQSAASLLETVRGYAEYLLGLRGGTAELQSLFERNDELAAAVANLNDRVFDHTGTSPLLLDTIDDGDGDDWDEEDEEPEALEGQICVLSRWDLNIHDANALLAAGRDAHRRLDPKENEEDAAVAVSNLGEALYAITHEAGEPWFDLPGVDVASGARVYLLADEPGAPLPDEPGQMLDHVTSPPTGRVAYSEGW